MQLTSLEIQGFKSFADKTTFLFDKGITGVVGPNGCGKSNIVDSIRWVLGEQKTRKLRSEKMGNIIFNGTTKRRKGSFASVTLTFENTKNILPTEYSTVAVNRKLYRNGDSSYAINDVPCRLKDVHNLFLDTGIGPDSYAIIELKMVDEILNDKENSRRMLFEEAAGISKYKIRKKETLRKLEDTRKDLERVEDVLFEIEKQLKALEKQARKAKRYLEIKAKYQLISSQYSWFAIAELRQDYDSIQAEEKKFEDQTSAFQATIAKHEARIMELRRDQLENENRLADSQKDLNKHIATIREIEKDKSIRNERLKYLQQREIAIANQLEQDKKVFLRTGEELTGIQTQLAQVQAEHKDAKVVLDGLKVEHEDAKMILEELRFQVQGYDEEHRETETAFNKLQKEMEIKQIQIQSFRKEIERNEQDRSNRKEEMDAFAERLKELSEEVEGLVKTVDELRVLKEENETAREASAKVLEGLKDSIYKKNRGLDARINEYQLTKSLVENLEGFPESVKFLKKSANWAKDAPLLSDIFYTEETYKVAFENLLEPYLSYYIVEARVHAYQAIKLLSEAAKGRANFFVLEELEKYPASEKLEIPGAVAAMDVVEVGEKYHQLAAYLLDRVYVVDQDHLIPEDVPEDVIFITRQGDLQRRRYALGGGSVGLFQGKRLGRARNLQKLDVEIKAFEKELNEFKTHLYKEEQRLNDLRSKKYGKELDQKNQLLQTKTRELSVLTAREQEHQDFLKRVGQRTDQIEQEMVAFEKTVTEQTPHIATLKAKAADQLAILTESRLQQESRSSEVQENAQAFNEQNIRFIQLKNRMDLLDKDAQQRSSRIKELETAELKNKTELAETKKNIHELVDNSMQDDEEVVALYAEKKQKEDRTGKLEQVVGQMRINIQRTEELVREERKKKESQDDARNKVTEQVTDVKLKLNSLKERMQVEFQVDISDLDEEELFPDGIGQYTAQSIEDEMLKFRQRMQSYGEINPMAVEAYDEMKERFDFINEQKADLNSAKETLLNTISEIDKTATKKFMDAFEKVRTNFKEVFQHLFHPGDTCDLKLVDPDDPLESKIDIMAKPKGKRPLSINQLSGGEKTLTAISLLFAIYLLKPAPFCIFDEVDAPLDDANIDKFNNIVKEFSKDSQFILVTHNKRTMAATNIMYGVTMAEQGVSRVIPVDMVALNLD